MDLIKSVPTEPRIEYMSPAEFARLERARQADWHARLRLSDMYAFSVVKPYPFAVIGHTC